MIRIATYMVECVAVFCCWWKHHYSVPVRVHSIAINPSVCASVCLPVCEHISGIAPPIVTKFCAQIPGSCGLVLLRRRCTMLCTSAFMDDVTFGSNGLDAERWRLHTAMAINNVAIPGRSLLSTNACWCLVAVSVSVYWTVNGVSWTTTKWRASANHSVPHRETVSVAFLVPGRHITTNFVIQVVNDADNSQLTRLLIY